MANRTEEFRKKYDHAVMRLYELFKDGMHREQRLKEIIVALLDGNPLSEPQNKIIQELRQKAQ